MQELNRRRFVYMLMLAAGLVPQAGRLGLARKARARGLRFGPPASFSFESLVRRARERAQEAYRAPHRPAPDLVSKIDYDEHGQMNFDRDHALFRDEGVFPVTFFPLGKLFPSAVRMHTVQSGQAREILYDPSYFEIPEDSVARKLPRDVGFAGFRVHEAITRDDWKTQDWVAFLGASYFRAIGALGQYGLSARGIAVDTTAGGPEEFPAFTEFYLERAPDRASPLRVHALLDGPSISGAYRFECFRGRGVRMDVEARLFPRRDISQLGVAPLTSMFWYAQHNRPQAMDWRPEVHDSDGLALWTGDGEHVLRPLNNPSRVITSSFSDHDPKGFGLVQRDREADHYLDGVRYEHRPSLWVEPLDPWGAGRVQLVEIPTDDETHDNIAVFWRPDAPVAAGDSLRFRYRLHWTAHEPHRPAHVARVGATRIGRGGEPGTPRPEHTTKFVVEFEGQAIEGLSEEELPTAHVTASRGRIVSSFVERVPRTRKLRAVFDLSVLEDEPVELRMFLRRGNRALSETWLYQFEPKAR